MGCLVANESRDDFGHSVMIWHYWFDRYEILYEIISQLNEHINVILHTILSKDSVWATCGVCIYLNRPIYLNNLKGDFFIFQPLLKLTMIIWVQFGINRIFKNMKTRLNYRHYHVEAGSVMGERGRRKEVINFSLLLFVLTTETNKKHINN